MPCITVPPIKLASVGTIPNPFSFSGGDGVDRSDQFVFDRNPVFEDRHRHFLQARLEGRAQDQLFLLRRPFLADHSCDRLDPESLGGQRGIVAEQFDVVVQIDFDRAIPLGRLAAKLLQQIDQFVSSLGVHFGDFGTDESVDHDRPIRIEFPDQFLCRRRERTDFAFGQVVSDDVLVAKQDDRADGKHDQGNNPCQVVPGHRVAVLAAGPVTPTDQHHAGVQRDDCDQHESRRPKNC